VVERREPATAVEHDDGGAGPAARAAELGPNGRAGGFEIGAGAAGAEPWETAAVGGRNGREGHRDDHCETHDSGIAARIALTEDD
jgi:hypothetical protein